MNNNNAQRWSRTTGEALTRTYIDPKGVEHHAIKREFRLPPKPKGSREKRTEDTFVILALDLTLSNPKTFTFAKVKNKNTGDEFYTRIMHANGYMVPENQK